MIKLQDFARECGVTDRAIQKHLKTYAAELEGLYQRKGPNGTWLSDEACEILRSKLKKQPMVIGDSETYRENEDLKKKIELLQDKLIAAHEKIEAQQLQLDQGRETLLLLQAAEKETKILEGFVADAKAEIKALHEEKNAAVAAARQEGFAEAEQRFRSMSLWAFMKERRK